MAKIKVSADTVLSILQGIMNHEDVNYTITDKSAPISWQGKKVQEVLNVDYYTYRHRPMDTEIIIRDLLAQGKSAESLFSLNRSFCLLSLNSTERVFSKDNDIVTVSSNLEYWLQAEKVKILEDLIEDMTIETTGIRIPVQIGNEMRKAIIVFGSLNVSEIEEISEFGEMAVCDLNIDIIFYPDVVSKSDYTAEFLVTETGTTKQKWVKLPFSAISMACNSTQKAVPCMNRSTDVGSINLSKVRTFVFAFDGYKNEIIDNLVKIAFASDYSIIEGETEEQDINERIILRITRGDDNFVFDCVLKDHNITVQEDTGNETHSLILATRGMINGTT